MYGIEWDGFLTRNQWEWLCIEIIWLISFAYQNSSFVAIIWNVLTVTLDVRKCINLSIIWQDNRSKKTYWKQSKPGGFSKELHFIFGMYFHILLKLLITRSVPFSMSYTSLSFRNVLIQTMKLSTLTFNFLLYFPHTGQCVCRKSFFSCIFCHIWGIYFLLV